MLLELVPMLGGNVERALDAMRELHRIVAGAGGVSPLPLPARGAPLRTGRDYALDCSRAAATISAPPRTTSSCATGESGEKGSSRPSKRITDRE